MTHYTLPGLYSNRDAEAIKQRMNGKTYMDFVIEYGGIAGNNEISVMTARPDTTPSELADMFIYCALTL